MSRRPAASVKVSGVRRNLKRRLLLPYFLLVGLPLAGLIAMLQTTRALEPSTVIVPPHGAIPPPPAALNLVTLMFQLAVILAVSRGVAMLFRRLRQPQVIGEMVGGILLGPSFLGWLAPALSHSLFPLSSLAYLNALSQLGLVLFMFLIGLSLNPKELREHGHAAILTSHASIVLPFSLGGALAMFLYPRLSDAHIGITNFALFMGSAMSITAFPVLARILADRNLLRSRMGMLSITCAAVDDITGWCILAYIVVLVRAGTAASSILLTIGGVVGYLLIMFVGVRPLLRYLRRRFQREKELTDGGVSFLVVLALLSALVTEWLGIHLVFGAFLLGAVMPKDRGLVDVLQRKLESVTVIVLLPLFFAFSGLRTNIGLVRGGMWFYALLIILVAITGKFGGSTIAARMAGVPWRDAASLGILMNTRGLMELIALNIGLDIGVISPAVFTLMVLMALFTTFTTSPLLQWVYPTQLVVLQPETAVAKGVA
jgi:Kef-type K+ transport system membrane component KefB